MRDAKLSYESLFYFSLQKRQKKAVMRIIVGLCKIIKIIGSIMVSGGNWLSAVYYGTSASQGVVVHGDPSVPTIIANKAV